MKRRNFVKNFPLAVTAAAGVNSPINSPTASAPKPALTIAHITDVHIRPENGIPARFRKCLEEVKRKKVDFFLNTGDSIHAADYKDITRERVLEQWAAWDECKSGFDGYELYTCIGNHDPWWAAPSKDDEMYGIGYVVKRANMPHRYYSFSKKNWHFMVLDGNNPGISLDEEQLTWLRKELQAVPKGHFVLLMSHYPILTVTASWEGGQHKDHKLLKELFYEHKDKVRVCLSGHQHLLDAAVYNNVHYYCNGAMSGFWWDKGDAKSAQPGYYQETPPGYAVLKLYEDGRVENTYYEHHN